MKLLRTMLMVSALALATSCAAPAAKEETAVKQPEVNSAETEAAMAAARGNPLDGVVKAFQKAQALKSFRARLESTAEGRTSVINFEFVAPDRYRMLNGPTELLVVGENAYLKTLGAWQKVATGVQDQMKSISDPKLLEQIRQATDVKFVQPDTLAGKLMLVYEYTSTDLPGIRGKSASKTWVGMFDGLPYKSEFSSEFGSVKSKGVMTWHDFDADIKIEPPLKQ